MGKLGGKASPRKDAWRNMSDEERAANAKLGAAARWSATSEEGRKAQMAKVRAARAAKA